MAKKCSKGHIYDSAIYGDNCPFCPSQGMGTAVNNFGGGDTVNKYGGGTAVNQDGGGRTHVNSSGGVTGIPTIPMGGGVPESGGIAGGTVIRPVGGNGGTGTPSGRRIVGIFATYGTVSTGQVFNIYEGRNYIGRDITSDVSIQVDSQVSSKHFSVLYRIADGKFKFKDEQSSNGTFLNDVLTDEGELNTFDVIRIGSTKLVFIAIPQIQ
jgi:hypothetical protein